MENTTVSLPIHSRAKAEAIVENIPDAELRCLALKSCKPDASLRQQVEVFHRVYGLPIVTPDKASLDFSHITRERLTMRFALIEEEFIELCSAMDIKAEIVYKYLDEEDRWVTADDINDAIENTEERNMIEVADACADLKYVIVGFECEVGIPSEPVGAEVHWANMSKLGGDGKPIYRGDGKVLKGPNYFKADVRNALSAYGVRFSRQVNNTPSLPEAPDQASGLQD